MLLALDISTSCTGYAIFDLDKSDAENDNLKEIGFIKLSKFKTFFEKVKHVKSEIEKLNKKYNITAIAVEENLQAFRPGLSSAKTLMTLAQFNGTVRWVCYEMFNIESESINVNAARKLIELKVNRKSNVNTKDQVLEWVSKDCPNIDWPMKTLKSGRNKGQVRVDSSSYDMADAYVIGKAYLKL